MNDRSIKVIVVEDSSVVRDLLVHILRSDPAIQVIKTANNGRQAVEMLAEHSPDVIVMDINMPEMDGFEATRRIMETRPVPIVICSGSTDPNETMTAFRSMEAGAVACIEKPRGREHKNFDATAARLLQTVRLMSEVKVVRRWVRSRQAPAADAPSSRAISSRAIEVVGIGASTGGPPVLQTILAGLSKDFPVPLLVVQHIAPGFLPGLVDWLNQTTGVKVHIAAYAAQLIPGHVYLAPDDYHMEIRTGGRITLTKEPPENGLRPAVAKLFRSLAAEYGSGAAGVLLTGMGKDGANELKEMKDRGAVTLVQDRETSVVHGMPGEAIRLGAAAYVLPADKIAPALDALVRQRLAPKQGLS